MNLLYEINSALSDWLRENKIDADEVGVRKGEENVYEAYFNNVIVGPGESCDYVIEFRHSDLEYIDPMFLDLYIRNMIAKQVLPL